MKKIFEKVNEAGTMLVEAMAMLGLIAMVTPILYKKAAERTTELQDINASNQLRVLSNAMDAYIKDNFSRINSGETVTNSCNEGTVDYSGFSDDTTISFDLSHLCEYLPYGFLKDGKTQDTKIFSKSGDSFKVVLRRTTGTETAEDGKEVIVAQTVTGFLTAIPNEGEDFPSTRTSRIATMVGSNGGYVADDGSIMGAQGIWSLTGDSELDLKLPKNSFVISSLQPISSQGLANEDVLHRKTERQNDYVLNSMETDLFMSYNDKNHNIRQVNQIIMSPQPDWMLGGDQNNFTRATDDTPKSELSEYKADLDHTLYIGAKGGAFIEGNMAALDSLFTVRSEADGGDDGGIKYYGTDATTDNTDPSNPVTTNTRGSNIFSVTTTKMEYGNIGTDTAGALLTVDKENNSMEFESKTSNTPPDGGDPTTSSQKLIAANAERVNIIDGALSIRNPGVAPDGKYDDYHKNQWPEQNAAPAVIVGGGNVHNASYTTYTYDDDGNPVMTDGEFTSTDLIGEHALTVNGPAFIKDSLKTAKLKAYNVDAAVLRAGVRPEDFNTVTEDPDFYLVAQKKSDDNARMLVGHYTDAATGENRYRLQISEADETVTNGAGDTEVQKGIRMNHESGINLLAADAGGTNKVGLIQHDVDTNTSSTNLDTADGQIKLGAFDAISLATIDDQGEFIDRSVVSIQDDMLRAYNIKDTGGSGHEGYIDSVTNHARFISQGFVDAGLNHDDLYSRSADSKIFALGDMDFTISEVGTGTDATGNPVPAARPIADIRSYRGEDYMTSRFSGGFAVYDHDVGGADYPDNASTMGNPALYVNKGDFRILATESSDATDATLNITKGDTILQVDNNSDTGVIPDDDDRGSVYIRKGAINLATNGDSRLLNSDVAADYKTDEAKYPMGYISADRFISHTVPAAAALNASATSVNSGGTIDGTDGKTLTPYEKYEVNPAYTSVMNDIKLTTRGGARLSDILPDFINRGIYVVDNTYKDDIKWVGSNAATLKDQEVGTGSAEAFTSAYLGFVPAPTCPPGYSKVITINPSGWAMAQAGTPVYRDSKIDINTHNNPYLYWYTQDGVSRTVADEVEPVNPLTFQKNNWLKAMVMPECNKRFQESGICGDLTSFKGWGTVMGFIYPAAYYDDFISGNVGGHKVGGGNADTGNLQNTVYWNLYPVHYRELEAYVTVYCYFRRAAFDSDYVDTTYDQLNDFNTTGVHRDFWDKSKATNLENLNDPALKYNDPW